MWILLVAGGRIHFFQFETGFDADNKSSSAVNRESKFLPLSLFIVWFRCRSDSFLLLFPPICKNQSSVTSEVHSVFSPNVRCLQHDRLFYIDLKTGKIIPEQADVVRLTQPSTAQHSLSPHVQRLFLGVSREKKFSLDIRTCLFQFLPARMYMPLSLHPQSISYCK